MQRCALGTTVRVNRIIITTEDKLTDHSLLVDVAVADCKVESHLVETELVINS